MIRPRFIAIALALAAAVLHSATLAVTVDAQEPAAVVDIQIHSGQIFVPVVVKDQAMTFLLDTGTGDSFIDTGTAAGLGAQAIGVLAIRGFGSGVAQGGLLDRGLPVQIPATAKAAKVDVTRFMDLSRLSRLIGFDVHGILGGDVFRQYVIELDYAHARMTLLPRGHRGAGDTTIRMSFNREGHPVVPVTMHVTDSLKVKAKAMLDTGAGGLIMVKESFGRRHKLTEHLAATTPTTVAEGAGGKVVGQYARLPTLELAGTRLTSPILSLPTAATQGGIRDYDLNIGGDVLSRFVVTFNYRRSEVTLIPNGRLDTPFELGMTGLGLATTGPPHGTVIVEFVEPGSPAALSGILAGDRIIAVNEAALDGLALLDLRQKLRQPEGTTLRITIRRGTAEGVATLTLRRIL